MSPSSSNLLAAALIYATFGLFAAMAFEDVGANILVILASSEVTGMPLSYFKHVSLIQSCRLDTSLASALLCLEYQLLGKIAC